MVTLSAVSDEVCERIIATEFHADVLDYLNSVDKLPDDEADKWTVRHQLLVLCNVVSRTSAHDDFTQRHAVDIASKFPTLTNDQVIFSNVLFSRRVDMRLSSVFIVHACKLPIKGSKT